MTLGRRFDLLRVAARNNAWILEDDYFSEFRYGTSPVASLQSLDRNERVHLHRKFQQERGSIPQDRLLGCSQAHCPHAKDGSHCR